MHEVYNQLMNYLLLLTSYRNFLQVLLYFLLYVFCKFACIEITHDRILALGESNADRVDAVAIARGSLWRVFEDVTQVATAGGAANFGANHTVRTIFD